MNGKIILSAPAARLPELDGLRAIAILLVLISHHLRYAPIACVRWFTEMGWIGVDLFFVLSGFLIGGILLDQRTAANYYTVFYLRRFLRIVPLYALLVVPGLLVLGCGLQSHFSGHSLAGQSAAGMWSCVFFIQNVGTIFGLGIPRYLGPTWSVAVEEQFYLLLPPLVRNLNLKKLLTVLVVAIVFAPVLRGILILELGDKAAQMCYNFLPCRWDSLLMGVICAFAYRDVKLKESVFNRLPWLRIFWCVSASVSLFLLFSSRDHNEGSSPLGSMLDPKLGFLGYTVIDAWFACTLLLAVLNPHGHLKRVLSNPFFKPIATVSYGLYLLQSPMMAITESVMHFAHIHYASVSWTATGVALASLAATGVAATLSWKFFESRLIRLGHQHKYQLPDASPPK
jgi:peptidoglycan/LPS O-acetylase OafA/YrhL